MEGWIARWYARTRRKDMPGFLRDAEAVAKHVAAGSDVLEVAPGPGFFAIELAKLGNFRITGLDVSRTFVEIATANAQDAGVNVDFRLGNASAMPFAENSFDFVYCSAAFKNFSEPVKALDEIHRVLRPGGRAAVVDLRRDVSAAELESYVNQSGRGSFDAWMTKWAFRSMLIKRAYARDEFVRMAQESGFGGCEIGASLDAIALEARFTKPAASPSVARG